MTMQPKHPLVITERELNVMERCAKHGMHIHALLRRGRRHKIMAEADIRNCVELLVIAVVFNILGWTFNINVVAGWLLLSCFHHVGLAWGLAYAAKICRKVCSAKFFGGREIWVHKGE